MKYKKSASIRGHFFRGETERASKALKKRRRFRAFNYAAAFCRNGLLPAALSKGLQKQLLFSAVSQPVG
jgi:hypothetical protein